MTNLKSDMTSSVQGDSVNNLDSKFDKTKKTLTIKLPVIGLTEDGQRVADQHWQEYLEMERKREEEYKNLEMSTI